jgi:hypothetical protein
MRFRTILEVLCLSHNSCCDVVFCNTKEANVRNRNLRARVVYVTFFFLVTFGIMMTRTYAEGFLIPTFTSYECSASLQILTCFQVNMLLRISGALFIFHLIMAVLSAINDDISIFVNEGFWVMKFLSFWTILFFNMFVPLYVWIIYGVFAKLVSIVVLALQIIIFNDSILIICEQVIVPFKESGKCQFITTIIFGYIFPIAANLTIFAYNFMVYTPICSPYLLINTMILLLITLLIVINLMRLRNITGPLIASLWFTLFIGVLNNSMLASTPHSSCKVLDSDGNYSTSVLYGDVVFDSVLSFLLLGVTFVFLCALTKKDAKKFSYYVESWFYYFVLREVGNSYMKYHPKNKKRKGKLGESKITAPVELKNNNNGLDEVFRQIVDKNVVRKMAAGSLRIPDDFDPTRVRFRSKQAFFFHLLLTLFGAYTAVIFTSWIHITIDDIQTGAEAYDNTSIWARFFAVALGVMFSAVKVFRAYYHYSRLMEEEGGYMRREDDEVEA